MSSMRAWSRLSWIAVGLVALGMPVAGVCEAAEAGSAACEMAAHHGMPGCAGEASLAPGCCNPSTLEAAPELILIRPGDGGGGLATSADAAPPVPAAIHPFRLRAPDPAPPPQPAPYRLFSALLL